MRRAIFRGLPRPCACAFASRPLLAPTASPASPFARFTSDSPSITERIRRNLWGTDKPPGTSDPYKRVPPTPGNVVASDDIDPEYREALDARGLPIAGLEETGAWWHVFVYISSLLGTAQLGGQHRVLML